MTPKTHSYHKASPHFSRWLRQRCLGVALLLPFVLVSGSECAELTLDEALGRAMKYHPAIAERTAEVKVKVAEALRGAEPMNPELELEVFSLNDQPEVEIKLYQPIRRGVLGVRKAYAAAIRASGEVSTQATVVSVLNATNQAYLKVWGLQEQVKLTQQRKKQALAVAEKIEVGLNQGQGSAADAALFEAEIARADAELTLQAAALQQARLQLALNTGSAGNEPVVASPTFAAIPKDLNQLVQFAVSRSPLRKALLAERTVAEKEIRIAEVEALPEMRPGLILGYADESEEAMIGFGFTMELPLRNKNQRAIDAATARRTFLEQRLALQSEDRLRAQIEVHWKAAQASQEAASTYLSKVIPAYQKAGKQLNMMLENAQASLLDIWLVQESIAEQYEKALEIKIKALEDRASLEALLGGRIEEVISIKGSK